jgi:hypothetical protein
VSDTPSQALRSLLQPLCQTPEDLRVLEQLCEAVKEFGDGTVSFDGGDFTFTAGGEVPFVEGVPRSFSEISRVAKSISWDAGGPEAGYAISDKGRPIADDQGLEFLEDEGDEAYDRIMEAGGAMAAFSYGQNWTFFDPTRKLANGEPALAFVSHEGDGWVEVESVDDLNYKQILLRMISDAMLGTEHIPEIYC